MLPLTSGTGFKPEHYAAMRASQFKPGFIEIHAENYMGDGGLPHAMLADLRSDHALSVHGVGLSIGGNEPLSLEHLKRLRNLCRRYQPDSFSEHLAWSSHQGVYLNDLLPLPYSKATLRRIKDHIDQTQEILGLRILLENPSTYVEFDESDIPEFDFLAEIARSCDCGLLLDVNNVYVSCRNRGHDPETYLLNFPWQFVNEIHLAGHAATEVDDYGPSLWIDNHGSRIADDVWRLYDLSIRLGDAKPTLIEWDNDVPEWDVLASQARRAQDFMDSLLKAA